MDCPSSPYSLTHKIEREQLPRVHGSSVHRARARAQQPCSALLTRQCTALLPAMSLSTYAQEFDSADRNARPELGRGLCMRPKRYIRKKRCMLTDSLRTRFDKEINLLGIKMRGLGTYIQNLSFSHIL